MPKYARAIIYIGLAIGATSISVHADEAIPSGNGPNSSTVSPPPNTDNSKTDPSLPAPNSSRIIHWSGRNVVTAGGFGANPVPGVVGSPGSLGLAFRMQEDYSYLRDPSLSTDYLDPLKYIPFNDAGDIYLTLNGDERIKYEQLNHGNLGVAKTPITYFPATGTATGKPCVKCNEAESYSVRNDVGADLHLTPYLRFYGEFINAERSGANQGTTGQSATARQHLTLIQGLGEVDTYFGGAQEGLQVGRWLPIWGWDNSGASTLPNVFAPAVDGANFFYDNGGFRTAGFYGVPVTQKLGQLQSTDNMNQGMWGDNNTFVLPQVSLLGTPIKANVDAFYYGLREGGVGGTAGGSWQNTATAKYANPVGGKQSVTFQNGQDLRQTLLLRHYGSWGNWGFDNSVAGQVGSFNGMDVEAFEVNTKNGYTFTDLPWKPNLLLRMDVASGGAHKSGKGGTLNDFLPIDEAAFIFVPNSFLVHSNLIDIAPHLVVSPLPNVSVDSFVEPFWRYSPGDAVQNQQIAAAPPAYALTAFVPGSYVGTMLDMRPEWAITPHLSFSAEVSYMLAGEVLREAGGKNTFYSFVQLEYKW
jgi:hypothetical protein